MQIAGEFVRKQVGEIEAICVTDRVLLKTLVELYPEYENLLKECGSKGKTENSLEQI